MTKKIKFLDDAKTLSILVVTENKIYPITKETETHYTFYDDDNIKTSIYKLKSGYKFEIIEEPKVTKYIKIITFTGTSQSWYKDLTLNRYYKVTHEDNSRYYFNDNIGSKVFITKDSPNYIISEGHPYKHLIKKAAELAEETMDVGKHFQYKDGVTGEWVDCGILPSFHIDTEFRLKPRTIKIGNREINAPEREPLRDGQKHFYPSLANTSLCMSDVWCNNEHDQRRLAKGVIFLTKEDAIAAAEAMIELLRGRE